MSDCLQVQINTLSMKRKRVICIQRPVCDIIHHHYYFYVLTIIPAMLAISSPLIKP